METNSSNWSLVRELPSLFRKQDYAKTPQARANWLTYLIALGQPIQSIEKALTGKWEEVKTLSQKARKAKPAKRAQIRAERDQKREKLGRLFTRGVTNHKLTCWHVAVLKGAEYVDVLIRLHKALQLPPVAAQDAHGWTPAHYAVAIQADTIFQTLIDSSSVDATPASGCPSVEELPFLLGHQPLILNRNVTYIDSEGEAHPISEVALPVFASGGAQASSSSLLYTDQVVIRLDTLWAPGREFLVEPAVMMSTSLLGADLIRRYIYREGHPEPHLAVKATAELKETGEAPLGVFAGENLPLGTAVGEYTGRYMEGSVDYPSINFQIQSEDGRKYGLAYCFCKSQVELSYRDYQLTHVNADTVGNVTRFMNDGPPNVITVTHYPDRSNRPSKTYMVTTGDVAEGEQLFWDYLCETHVKFGNYKFDPEYLERVYTENPPKELHRSYQTVYQDIPVLAAKLRKLKRPLRPEEIESLIKKNHQLSLYFYIQHTPTVLSYLVLKGMISKKILMKMKQELDEEPSNVFKTQISLFIKNGLLPVVNGLKKIKDQQFKEEMVEYILQRLNEQPVYHSIYEIKTLGMLLSEVSVEDLPTAWEAFEAGESPYLNLTSTQRGLDLFLEESQALGPFLGG